MPGQFTSKRTLKMLMQEIPHDRSEDYAAFRRVVKADEAQQITLENQAPGAGGVAAGNQSAERPVRRCACRLFRISTTKQPSTCCSGW